MKILSLFIAVALALGVAALAAGYAIGGEDALLQGGVAFALAFVPAAASLGFVLFSYTAGSDMRLLATLGGSGFRMAIALGGGFLLTRAQPEYFTMAFWYWLLVFYMALLGFEIALIVRQQHELAPAPTGTAGADRIPQA